MRSKPEKSKKTVCADCGTPYSVFRIRLADGVHCICNACGADRIGCVKLYRDAAGNATSAEYRSRESND